MITHRRQLRRWAAGMLLTWLFAVFVGIAHACAAGSPSHHAVGPAVIEHVSLHSQHGDEDQDAKAVCEEFCDLSSATVPSQATALDKVATPVISIGFAGMALPVAPPLRLQRTRPPTRTSAPPIPIEFLRLTL